MAFLNNSSLATASAAQQIADAAGASGDTEMITRAGRSYAAAINHFSNFANWEWVLTEAPTILVTAPFDVTGATASANDNKLTNLPTGHGVLPDDFITGPMFASNSAGRVTATATAAGPVGVIGFAETFNASLIPTAASSYTVTANRDMYDLPTDWKQPYSVRMLAAQYTLRPIGRRHYDRSVTSEFVFAGTPLYYDIFTIGVKSKIRVLRPPAQTDRMQLRYYRRLSPDTTPCDIPAQYEAYLIAFAKWHFLTDKADMRERGSDWLQFATNGLQQMLKESTRQPDEDLMFLPGHYSMNVALGPNSTRQYLDDW